MGVKIKDYLPTNHKERPPLREALNNTDSLRPLRGAVTGISGHRVGGGRRRAQALLGRP
jgi:hypothetical protein